MDARFQSTHWSMVLAARTNSSPQSHEALSSLCGAYWYPLYAFVRRQGFNADEARDLTQAYFVKLLEKRYLRDVDPAAGRFRTFLLASMKHFLSNERDRGRALKRGGGKVPIPLDSGDAEKRYVIEPVDPLTPDRLFERRWALTVLERVGDRLRDEMAGDGKGEIYDRLHPFITGGADHRPYRELGAELSMSETAVKAAVHRLRKRFGNLLRDEIAQTVASPDQVEPEIRHLLECVRVRT